MNYSFGQLSYLGDAVYEIYVRDYLIKSGVVKLKDLQKDSLDFVTAKSQCFFVKELSNGFFSDKELDIIRQGRNMKTISKPKSCDVITYRYATALEVLFGYLYVSGNVSRLDEIFEEIVRIRNE